MKRALSPFAFSQIPHDQARDAIAADLHIFALSIGQRRKRGRPLSAQAFNAAPYSVFARGINRRLAFGFKSHFMQPRELPHLRPRNR